jgi:TusA-related sulfurtransferase
VLRHFAQIPQDKGGYKMEKPKIIIDVRNMPDVSDRPKKVSRELDKIESAEYAEIIADDKRMLKLAPQMIKGIGKADFIKSWKGDNEFYHTLIKKR